MIYFVKSINSKEEDFNIEIDSESTIVLNFEEIKEDTCTARIWEGYYIDKEKGITLDVFKMLFDFDSMFVNYFNEDMTTQSICVPLYSFRQQYLLLPE